MHVTIKALGFAALAALVGMPALADMNVPAVTCGEFAAMDDPGKTNFATDFVIWVNDANNKTEAAGLEQYCDKCGNGTPDEMIQIIEGKCADQAADKIIVERLKEPH